MHHYGSQFELIETSVVTTLLARLCHEDCHQPEMNRLVEVLYRELIAAAIDKEFPKMPYQLPTRMQAQEPRAVLNFLGVDQDLKAVVVNLARAGTYPSHVLFEFLHHFLAAENLRQDHIFASRKTNQKEQVVGAELGAAKIGKDLQDDFVLIPDPMGATGSTLSETLGFYKNRYRQQPSPRSPQFICLHLIVTPEYLRRLITDHPDVKIYALRVDRGLSPDFVLQAPLGHFWDQEIGLNSQGYIVPGAGGFGELMNNCFE